MASPADFMQSTALPGVAAIRTSGDYRYLIGNAALWFWYLHTNALARALDLPAFKDVFLSSREGSDRDGDPHAEIEALLAVLGAGPVGIGDRLGRTDRELVMRTCRADGLLVKPDTAVAALDRCYRAHAMLAPSALVGETFTRHPAGAWVYVLAVNVHVGGGPLRFDLPLGELGAQAPRGPAIAYDWRSGALERLAPDGALRFDLAPLEWSFRVLCPVLEGDVALIGDPALYVTAGDRRIHGVRAASGGAGIELEVVGAPGERVRVAGTGPHGLRADVSAGEIHERLPAPPSALRAWEQACDGRFHLDLEIPPRGRVDVLLRP
jgi:hypothetical protein